jgi:CO dehydrogenase/acetyl-CoA synthase alpha subunit
MHLFAQIYEFASSAGALEGYVYRREDVDMKALTNWIANLKTAYGLLPPEALREVQTSIDQTLGRAWKSLALDLGQDHDLAQTVKSMIIGLLPETADDFQKKKWFQK